MKTRAARVHDLLVAKLVELEPTLRNEPHPLGRHRWGTVGAVEFCGRVLRRGSPASKAKLYRYLLDHNSTIGYRP